MTDFRLSVVIATPLSSRDPLQSTTNNSSPSPPSSGNLVDAATKSNSNAVSSSKVCSREFSLRHKIAVQQLPHLDSSESYPSYHSSLYDASLDHGLESKCTDSMSNKASDHAAEELFDSTNAHLIPTTDQLRAHQPHLLDPIIERSSNSTLRPSMSRDTHRHQNVATTASLFSLRPHTIGLRKEVGRLHEKSFSLPDLSSSHYPLSLLAPSVEAGDRLSLYPLTPSHPPPTRTPTPPNLPPFGTTAAMNYRLPPPTVPSRPPQASKRDSTYTTPSSDPKTSTSRTSKLKKCFRPTLPSTAPEMSEWRRQTRGLPRGGVVMRGDDGTLVRGRFYPGVSGQLGVPARGWAGGVPRQVGTAQAPAGGIDNGIARSAPEQGPGHHDRNFRGENGGLSLSPRLRPNDRGAQNNASGRRRRRWWKVGSGRETPYGRKSIKQAKRRGLKGLEGLDSFLKRVAARGKRIWQGCKSSSLSSLSCCN